MQRHRLLLPLMALLLAACGGPRTYAEQEEFHIDSRHRKDFAAAATPLCEAARRVLLGDGYLVEGGTDQTFVGAKEFQIEEKRHAILRIYVTCGQRAAGSTLFATATEEHYDVKTSRQSTTIGVPLVAPISVGGKSETDHQVKTLGETVTDSAFYERFYRAVQRELGR
jgi:hypothetical protein